MANLKQVLAKKIPKSLHEFLPKSFDQVGDIAIFSDLSPKLKKYEKEIADTMLKLHSHIKVVTKKTGAYQGKYRTPKLKILAGENRKTTIHKENNTRLKINPETTYFSQRSASERARITKQVKKGETILVMFSGIAPFPCVIAKNAKPKEIYAIEINPEAHKFAQENIKLNHLTNIKLFKGNVTKVLPKINKKFDRIIMPLPKSASYYLGLAKKYSKKGTIIHFYDFQKEKNMEIFPIKKIEKHFKNFKVLKITKCGQYGPEKYRICVDFKI